MKPNIVLSSRFLLHLFLALLLFQAALFAQQADKAKELDSMSLEEMLDIKISVASKTGMTQRESPGIVTVITQEEIINSGARDLADVLMLVPGYMLAVDVQNTVGIGIRGSWAHEGKVLLLVDGLEFNEILYSTMPLGNHFSMEQIKRIEIIRGPGSAIYGGFAELGVINIITKSASDVNGIAAAASYGQMAHTYGQRNVNLSFGKAIKDFNIVAHTFWGQGNRSDLDYTDVYGSSFNMKGNSALDPFNLNLGVGYKGFSTRLIVDRYHTTTRDLYVESLPQAIQDDFNSLFLESKYELKIGSKLSLTPRFRFKQQSPYHCVSDACAELEVTYTKTAQRIQEDITLAYDPTPKLNFQLGGEFYNDRASASADAPDYDLFADGAHSVSYTDKAFFAQGLLRSRWADLTLGARVENHSLAGTSFAPRFGITKVKGKFHVKVLASRAFRAPGIENLRLNPEIKPENTTIIEFEAGYRPTKNSILTGNVFDSRIKKPIVYSYDAVLGQEVYGNFARTGTRGFELDFRTKSEWGYLDVNYSYYRAHNNQADYYAVDGNSTLLLGFPAQKLAASANIRISKQLALNPSLILFSKRYGYDTSIDTGEPPKKYDPQCLTNLNFTWRDFVSKGLDLDIGVYDIFAQNMLFIQPYKGSHAPLPGSSREVRVRLAHRWGL